MNRSVVALKKGNRNHVIPLFSDCLLEYFNKEASSVTINYTMQNGMLILEESNTGHELIHSPECPVKLNFKSESVKSETILKNNNQNRSAVGVATSVVVESSDSYVLLTKRTEQMRSSPNVWVTPGGHIENNETIFTTGVREVKEETGLDISSGKMTVLGFWENVYPLLLGIGTPKTHTLIVYTHICLNENHNQLTNKIIPNADEVGSYCWLSSSTLKKMFAFEDINFEGKQYVIENGKMIKRTLEYSTMFNKWLWSQSLPYSGVNYALRKWIEKIEKQNTSSKF